MAVLGGPGAEGLGGKGLSVRRAWSRGAVESWSRGQRFSRLLLSVLCLLLLLSGDDGGD